MALICNGLGTGVAVGTAVAVRVGGGVSVGSEGVGETGTPVGIAGAALGPQADRRNNNIKTQEAYKPILFIRYLYEYMIQPRFSS
jgi:hypothetical protein